MCHKQDCEGFMESHYPCPASPCSTPGQGPHFTPRSVITCPRKASALHSSALPSSAVASAQPGPPIGLYPSLALSYPRSHGVAQYLGLSSFLCLFSSWLRYWDRTCWQAFLCSPGVPPLLPAMASGSSLSCCIQTPQRPCSLHNVKKSSYPYQISEFETR